MILVLLGRSGCGKSTIAEELIRSHGYERVITCTTRGRREGEAEDAFYFMTYEEFKEHLRNDDFVEFAKYGGMFYGTLRSSLATGKKLVCVVTPEGAAAIKKEFPDTFIINVQVDMKTSVMRAIAREPEMDPEKMAKISDRAIMDCRIFSNPPVDFTLENPEGASIGSVAKIVADAHEEYCRKILQKNKS